MECEYCHEPTSPSHQCINSVLKTLQEIEEEQDRQAIRLEKLQSQAKNLLNYSSLSKNLSMFRENQHIGTGCSKCNETPIIGIRFKCKQCPSYELCCKCRDVYFHQHSDFFILSVSSTHGIDCDNCHENIGEIRYICKECDNMNLCHKCVVSNLHPHLSLETVLPLVISVDIFPKKNLIIAVCETAILHIVICNMSVQPISNLTLKVISGEIPFHFKPPLFDFTLNVGCKKTLMLKGKINNEPGQYTSTLRLFSETYQQWVGTDIILNITVTADYLEGLKQSLKL